MFNKAQSNSNETNIGPSIKQPPRLFTETQQAIANIEAHLGAPLVCYWNSPRGDRKSVV